MDEFFTFVFFAFIFWVCWRWFLRNWVNSLAVTKTAKAKLAAHQVPDEIYYAQAAREVKDSIISEGLWVKAWSEAEGDDTKAKALYIKLRVVELRKQAAGFFENNSYQNEPDTVKTIIQCERCGHNLRVAAGKLLKVKCPKCFAEFETKTPTALVTPQTTQSPQPPFKSSYGSDFSRYVYAVIACALILIAYFTIAAIIGWKGGGGVIPVMLMLACVAWVWNLITDKKD